MTHARVRIVGDRIASAKSNVLLLGPRQVGKSTLCRELDPALYVDLADERALRLGTLPEVDLVIDTGREILAIEVKAGRNVSAADTRGLVSLSELIPGRRPYRPWIVFRGSRRQRFENGVEAVPVLEALAELATLGA